MGKFQPGLRWGHVGYLLTVGALCMLLGPAWQGWTYYKFEGFARLWQDLDHAFERLTTTWPDHVVEITIVTSAVDSGAVCLDGSPPAYFLDRGTGEGANNWVVWLEGGGWCSSNEICLERSFTSLGSSRYMPRSIRAEAILDNCPTANPDFYNWNRAMVKYCDGGVFNGDVSEPVTVETVSHHLKEGKAPTIFYRGQKIWMAVMEDLLENGMIHAEKAFLTGSSAGGIASILHCDQYRGLMPEETTVKCLSDAGFFIDIPDISGVHRIGNTYAKLALLQNMTGNLPNSCTSLRTATECMFPEYLIADIKTPLFILNPAYDTHQFKGNLVPWQANPEGSWNDCLDDIFACSENQLEVAQGFRSELLKRLQPLLENKKDGAYMDSCYLHSQMEDSSIWSGNTGPKVDNKSIAKAVGDWYFERNLSKIIDCPFPCNPTCRSY